MPNIIKSTSSGNDRYSRRDFTTIEGVDRYGNKTTKDNAGNTRLIAKEDGTEPDFSYQTKYNLQVTKDKFGDNKVNASVLDDAFIETLSNKTKGLLDYGMLRVSKALPTGEEQGVETEEIELTASGTKSLQNLIDSYNHYKNQDEHPINITLESISHKNVDNLDNDEIEFLDNLADYLKVDINTLMKNIKGEKPKKLSTFGLICQNCKTEVLEEANFCQNCGKKMISNCLGCNTPITENSNFCANCGMKLK